MPKKKTVISLVFQEPAKNHDKYYTMIRYEGNNSFEVHYGRMGSAGNSCTYPVEKWDSLYRQKVRKGYTDISSHPIRPGAVVKTPSNSLALVTGIMSYRDNEPEHISTEDEHGRIASFNVDEVTPGYLKPGSLTHEAFYPHLIKEFKKYKDNGYV